MQERSIQKTYPDFIDAASNGLRGEVNANPEGLDDIGAAAEA
jgi:hypothetical protein